MTTDTELDVQGQALSQIYDDYTKKKFIVNRRYQRKLVWSISEKQSLIDSVLKGLPIPLILLAKTEESKFEIIDGLQRLNAITAFIENEFSYNGKYFDLQTLGDTKDLLDKNLLVQKTPILEREICKQFTNYRIPISRYLEASEESVDEVFRRINSSGRKLSLQEIRQAGDTSTLSTLVRRLSSIIRGDVTTSDRLSLDKMSKVSISSNDLPYGIKSSEIFWVSNGILPEEDVRASKDEELVLDLVLDMVLDQLPATGQDTRDYAFNRGRRKNNKNISTETIDRKINQIGADIIEERFIYIIDIFKQLTNFNKQKISTWTLTSNLDRSDRGMRRYFHALFIPIYNIIYRKNKKLEDISKLSDKLKSFWGGDFTLPGGGGNWSSTKKNDHFDAVESRLNSCFVDSDNPIVKQSVQSMTEFESNLSIYLTENSYFELKQGFTFLDEDKKFNEKAFQKVIRTATAISNSISQEKTGIIYFGVADDSEDANRVQRIYSIEPKKHNSFFITGTKHELSQLGKSVDEFSRFLEQKISSMPIDNRGFLREILNSLTPFFYKDFLLWRISVTRPADQLPVKWDGYYYERHGSSTHKVSPEEEATFMRDFFLRK